MIKILFLLLPLGLSAQVDTVVIKNDYSFIVIETTKTATDTLRDMYVFRTPILGECTLERMTLVQHVLYHRNSQVSQFIELMPTLYDFWTVKQLLKGRDL